MPKNINDIYYDNQEKAYRVVRCDGTSYLLEIPCNCQGQYPDDIPPVDTSKCRMAYRYLEVWHGALLDNLGVLGYESDLTLPIVLQLKMLQMGIPVVFYWGLLYWAKEYRDVSAYWVEFSGGYQNEILLNAVSCCMPDDPVSFTDAFVECYVLTFMTNGGLQPELNTRYVSYVRDFMKIFSAGYRNYRVINTDVLVPQNLDCGSCEGEGENPPPIYGCAPGNEPYARKFTHLDDQDVWAGERFCVGSNHYDPCSKPGNNGFNCVYVNSPEINFLEGFVCVRRVTGNMQGRGVIRFASVDIWVKSLSGTWVRVGENITSVDKNHCQQGLGDSWTYDLPQPMVGTAIRVTGNRVEGDNPTPDQKLYWYCIQVTGGIIPSEPI